MAGWLPTVSPRRVPVSRVLVVTPTRELATQCQAMTEKLAVHTDVRAALIVGGLSMQAQEVALRGRPDIIICTPGRLIDHLRNSQSVHLEVRIRCLLFFSFFLSLSFFLFCCCGSVNKLV